MNVMRVVIPRIIATDLLSEISKVEQISELVFDYSGTSSPEIITWLKETTHDYEISKGEGKVRVTFKDIQGAIEFKLRFK
jgi:hypothetical protein